MKVIRLNSKGPQFSLSKSPQRPRFTLALALAFALALPFAFALASGCRNLEPPFAIPWHKSQVLFWISEFAPFETIKFDDHTSCYVHCYFWYFLLLQMDRAFPRRTRWWCWQSGFESGFELGGCWLASFFDPATLSHVKSARKIEPLIHWRLQDLLLRKKTPCCPATVHGKTRIRIRNPQKHRNILLKHLNQI